MNSLVNSIVNQHRRKKKNDKVDVRIVDVIDLDLSNADRNGEDPPDWALDYRTSDEEETDIEDQMQLMRQQCEDSSEGVLCNNCGSKIHQRVLLVTVLFVSLLFSVIVGAQYRYGNTGGIRSIYPPMNMATEVDVANAIQSYGEDQFEKSVEQLDHLEMTNIQPSNVVEWRKRRRLRGSINHNNYT